MAAPLSCTAHRAPCPRRYLRKRVNKRALAAGALAGSRRLQLRGAAANAVRPTPPTCDALGIPAVVNEKRPAKQQGPTRGGQLRAGDTGGPRREVQQAGASSLPCYSPATVQQVRHLL